ncbi:hypothetical protein ACFPPE_06925, partial [Agromyces tardus]|uniref:hypothetical protein n=1 Tax=Agromyces tardus TaxID=2583849 RepID=UPI0036120B57
LTTMWGQGHGYDQGGIFPNGTFGWNSSGLPEAVLTNPQWLMFRQFIDNMGGQNPETASQAQTIPETLNTDTLMGTTPSTTTDSSVDTWDTLRAKGETGLAGIASAFLEGQFDSIQNVTGMPDPRDTGLYEGITGYASDYTSWANAKSASAAATQALSSSNWGASSSPSTSTANQATSTSGGTGAANGGQILNDYSTTINITPSDTQEAFRQANQIADVRALQHTARK